MTASRDDDDLRVWIDEQLAKAPALADHPQWARRIALLLDLERTKPTVSDPAPRRTASG